MQKIIKKLKLCFLPYLIRVFRNPSCAFGHIWRALCIRCNWTCRSENTEKIRFFQKKYDFLLIPKDFWCIIKVTVGFVAAIIAVDLCNEHYETEGMKMSNQANQTLAGRYLAAKQALFDQKYAFLNEKQREAVYTMQGPLLVLAGAGTGKTTLLVNRIAYIMKYGNAYHSENIPVGISEETVLEMENATNLSQEDLDITINKIRDRVGMVHMKLADLPEGSDIRKEIQRERRVELFFEGHRYFDIIRWKQGELLAEDLLGVNRRWLDQSRLSVNLGGLTWKTKNGQQYLLIEEGRQFNPEKHYLLPVPFKQMQLNPNLAPQNPGWN